MEKSQTFDKCIICLRTPNDFDKNSKLTIEHIVPEFIGGKLTVKNVCKDCNSRLGGMLEGPLSKNFLFKCYSYLNGVKGKKSKLINPLAGEYSHPQGKIRFNDDFSIFKIPNYHFYEQDDGGFGYKISIDIKDINKIESEVFKALSRKASKKGHAIDRNKITEQLKKIHSLAEENINIIEQPEIEVSFSIDFDMMALLAIKIAYELIALKFSEIVLNEEFDKFRKSLYECILDPNITYTENDIFNWFSNILSSIPFFPKENISKVHELFKRNKTLVFFLHGKCSVRIINFWFNFDLPKPLSKVFLVFSSDSKTGEHNTYTDLDFFR